MLKWYGLPQESCKDIFNALVISLITYGIVAWAGFSRDQDLKRLRKVLRRGMKLGYYDKEINIEDIISK